MTFTEFLAEHAPLDGWLDPPEPGEFTILHAIEFARRIDGAVDEGQLLRGACRRYRAVQLPDDVRLALTQLWRLYEIADRSGTFILGTARRNLVRR